MRTNPLAASIDSEHLKHNIRRVWGKLSDDEIACCDGYREYFLNAVQRKYGIVREEAENTLRNLERESERA